MPRRGKGPRLYFREGKRGLDGYRRQGAWVIRDGSVERSTGCGLGDREGAEQKLSAYIVAKYRIPRERNRDPSQVFVADVIAIYAQDVAPTHARPKETGARLARLLAGLGNKSLDQINGKSCADYVDRRGSPAAARRELEDLRAAIRHHWRQGLCASAAPVVMPERSAGRERWLTRSEAARLLKAAWRLKERQGGKDTWRHTARHVARFILVGLYTGTRAGAICAASFGPHGTGGFCDLDRGVFYRRGEGSRETKKRQPPVRIPARLLAHLRRWHRLGTTRRYLIEWHGKPVRKLNKAFRAVRRAAGLGEDVTPHTLRHTCATWLMQSGVEMWEAAGFLGMTVETLERIYGHHHADHQANAVAALGKRRTRARDNGNVVVLGEGHAARTR